MTTSDIMQNRDISLRGWSSPLADLTLFSLFVFVPLAPLIELNASVGTLSGEGNAFRQAFYSVVFILSLIVTDVVRHPRRLLLVPVFVALTLLWSAASIFWAINPGVGARRLILTAMLIWSICLLVQRCGYARTTRILRLALVLFLIANFLAVIVAPQWAIHQPDEADPSIVGAWHGVLAQKNFAGPLCAMTILFFMFDAKNESGFLRFVVVIASAIFLYGTESKTSVSVTCICIVLSGLYPFYNPRYRVIAGHITALLLGVISLIIYLNWASITAPFDRQDTLTGRSQIWPILFQYWENNPILGAGFGSFWNIGDAAPVLQYTHGWVSKITSAHNGYLDLLVQIGLPGAVLATLAIAIVPVWITLTSQALNQSRLQLLISCIAFGCLHNLTESSMFERDALINVWLMTGVALLSQESLNRFGNAKHKVQSIAYQ